METFVRSGIVKELPPDATVVMEDGQIFKAAMDAQGAYLMSDGQKLHLQVGQRLSWPISMSQYILEQLGGHEFLWANDAVVMNHDAEFLRFSAHWRSGSRWTQVEIVPDIYGTFGVDIILVGSGEKDRSHRRIAAGQLRDLVLAELAAAKPGD